LNKLKELTNYLEKGHLGQLEGGGPRGSDGRKKRGNVGRLENSYFIGRKEFST